VSLALRTIRNAADVILGGVLIIPLWKSAKYWTFAFDDGRHLNRVLRVADATMRKACKVLIADSGLDPTLYATHSCKLGAALEALKAGLTDIQIQDLDRWTSASMVAK
jgi:hypothetical protein